MTAADALLADLEARRLANEELLAKATDHITRGVYANRLEVWTTAIRIVTKALPAIERQASRLPDPAWTELRLVYGDK